MDIHYFTEQQMVERKLLLSLDQMDSEQRTSAINWAIRNRGQFQRLLASQIKNGECNVKTYQKGIRFLKTGYSAIFSISFLIGGVPHRELCLRFAFTGIGFLLFICVLHRLICREKARITLLQHWQQESRCTLDQFACGFPDEQILSTE